MALTPAQQKSRRALDYRLVRALPDDCCVLVSAHSSESALRKGTAIDPARGEAGEATHYLAELRFPVLKGAGVTVEGTKVRFDISALVYPNEEPRVHVVSMPRPWSPHVLPGNGLVCTGGRWATARGKMTLVELIGHVARILNNDEPDREPAYGGWRPDAVAYWRTTMKCRPLNADLRYPVLPVAITHGIVADPEARAFAPVPDTGFAVPASPNGGEFQPREGWT